MHELQNAEAYLQSISLELAASMNQIRNLIGDVHWLTDGHHKEYLLLEILRRFLPTTMWAGRGFVVTDYRLRTCSKEQDILILDTRFASPLFRSAGVGVTFPELLVAAVSVKTELEPGELMDSLKGLNSIPRVDGDLTPLMCVFGFSAQDAWKNNAENLGKWLEKHSQIILQSSSPHQNYQLVIASNDGLYALLRREQDKPLRIRIYQRTQLASALVIALIADACLARCSTHGRSINDFVAQREFAIAWQNHES